MINTFFKTLLLLLVSLSSLQAQKVYESLLEEDYYVEKELRYEDWTYEKKIRTVQLYPMANMADEKEQPPIIDIRAQRSAPLMLEFDELGDENDYYEVEIIHCDADWTKSNEASINYLFEYNEFNVNDYEISINTKVPYVHYQFQVPPVKFSGNYLLVLYREDDREDVVITKRFMVYEAATNVGIRQERVIGALESQQRQQLNLTVDYSSLNVMNPTDDIQVVLRQNFRWDNAITSLEPNFNNQLRRTLMYNMNNLENTFFGGNQFRNFRTSGLHGSGFNIQKTITGDTLNQAVVLIDKSRNGRGYDSQLQDYNGRYHIEFQQTAQPETEADYIEVTFQLETGNPLSNEVYVVGAFSDWQLKAEHKMQYASAFGTYYATLFLKQGQYDYKYVEKNAAPNSLEGNHSRTENDYDVLVYFRPIGARGDRLIGYGRIQVN